MLGSFPIHRNFLDLTILILLNNEVPDIFLGTWYVGACNLCSPFKVRSHVLRSYRLVVLVYIYKLYLSVCEFEGMRRSTNKTHAKLRRLVYFLSLQKWNHSSIIPTP